MNEGALIAANMTRLYKLSFISMQAWCMSLVETGNGKGTSLLANMLYKLPFISPSSKLVIPFRAHLVYMHELSSQLQILAGLPSSMFLNAAHWWAFWQQCLCSLWRICRPGVLARLPSAILQDYTWKVCSFSSSHSDDQTLIGMPRNPVADSYSWDLYTCSS